MAVPAEELAYEHLLARLRAIQPAAGYFTDVGSRVYDGWVAESISGRSNPDPLLFPYIGVDEEAAIPDTAGEQIAALYGKPYSWDISYVVYLFMLSPSTADSEADAADLRHAVFRARDDVRTALLDSKFQGDFYPGKLTITGMDLSAREAGTRIYVASYLVTVGISECRSR